MRVRAEDGKEKKGKREGLELYIGDYGERGGEEGGNDE